MRTCLVLVGLAVAMPAYGDRKQVGPDPPPLGDVVTIELDQLESASPITECARLTWSIVIDVAHGTWTRSPGRCRERPPAAAVAHGSISTADLAPLYKQLDERAPSICDNKYPMIVADVVTTSGKSVELVELACEKILRLHELAAFVRALPPAR